MRNGTEPAQGLSLRKKGSALGRGTTHGMQGFIGVGSFGLALWFGREQAVFTRVMGLTVEEACHRSRNGASVCCLSRGKTPER